MSTQAGQDEAAVSLDQGLLSPSLSSLSCWLQTTLAAIIWKEKKELHGEKNHVTLQASEGELKLKTKQNNKTQKPASALGSIVLVFFFV